MGWMSIWGINSKPSSMNTEKHDSVYQHYFPTRPCTKEVDKKTNCELSVLCTYCILWWQWCCQNQKSVSFNYCSNMFVFACSCEDVSSVGCSNLRPCFCRWPNFSGPISLAGTEVDSTLLKEIVATVLLTRKLNLSPLRYTSNWDAFPYCGWTMSAVTVFVCRSFTLTQLSSV